MNNKSVYNLFHAVTCLFSSQLIIFIKHSLKCILFIFIHLEINTSGKCIAVSKIML